MSRVYEAVLAVPGVASVTPTRLQRWGRAPNNELELEVLTTSQREVIRLDNDPNFAENGRLELHMRGGS